MLEEFALENADGSPVQRVTLAVPWPEACGYCPATLPCNGDFVHLTKDGLEPWQIEVAHRCFNCNSTTCHVHKVTDGWLSGLLQNHGLSLRPLERHENELAALKFKPLTTDPDCTCTGTPHLKGGIHCRQ